MLIVGELINTSREDVNKAVESKNTAYIQELASAQFRAGAHYIDVNCGTQVLNEAKMMSWLVGTIQEVVDCPLCIDSADPVVLEAGLSTADPDKKPMINSITAEGETFANVLPLVKKYNTNIIALCMDDNGIPETLDDKILIIDKLVGDLISNGVAQDSIYLDPLVRPISTDKEAGTDVLKALLYIREKYPAVHTICGLSNVSFGLPCRKVLNQTFMIQTMAMGMDSYILDPLDRKMMGLIYASNALLGNDSFCREYLTAYKNGLYEG